MLKKLLVISALVMCLMCFFVSAGAAEQICEKISYCNADGSILTSWTEGEVIAKASINNITDSGIKPVLVVTSYKNGVMDGFWYESAEEVIPAGGTGEVSVTFTPVAADNTTTIKATLIDSLKSLKAYLKSAKMLNNTTALEGIFANGVLIDGYSDSVDEYKVKWNGEGKISAIVTDGSTTASVTQPEKLPGYSDIKVTSAFGDERNISVLLYEEEEHFYSLKNLRFMVDGTEYVVEDFEPDKLEYTVDLPKNTFYTTVVPEPYFDEAQVDVKVQDVNFQGKTFDGVYYRILGFHYVYKTSFVPRPAFDNLVPIKNEETIAIIKVSYEGEERTYTVNFRAQQPRLTLFSCPHMTTTTPLFVGGAALNNDNGTTFSSDRWWALTNISENLVGASMIVMPAKDNASANTWWMQNEEGVYIEFKADTPGTIYMMQSNEAKLEALNPQYALDGWEYIDQSHITGYTTGAEIKGLSTTFNDYGDDRYQASLQEYLDKTESRYGKDSYISTGGTIFNQFHKKTFAAGEVVQIHNVGKVYNGTNYPAKSSLSYFIVWDLEE